MTYRDMVDFSTILAERLDLVGLGSQRIAEVLVDLPASNEQTDKTNEILGSLFNRKRIIAIQPLSNGVYRMSCASFEGAVVHDKDIREGVSQLLDTLTVLKALEQ